jgi:quinol monooxygenase YgiN
MPNGNDHVVIVSVFVARPETWGDLRYRLEELVTASRQEPGCVRYDMYTDVSDPLRFVFVEEWADGDALAVHNKAPHLDALLTALPSLTAASPATYQLRAVALT